MPQKAKYPVAQIAVDGGSWEVPSEPLQGGMTGNFNTTRVSRPTDDVFALVPAFGGILFALLFLAFGSVILAMLASSLLDGKFVFPLPGGFWPNVGAVAGFCFMSFIAAMTVLMCLHMLTATIRFDKSAGIVRRRALFRTQTEMPLDDIVAVQCLYAGRASGKGGSYDILQLNLVVATGNAPRVCVCSSPDETWTRSTATELARFLNVTLIDQIAQTKSIYEANKWKWW